MTKTGIFALLFGLAAVVMVVIVAQDMRDSGFIIWAYVITAIILTTYMWLLARRLDQAQKGRAESKGDVGP